MWNTLRGFCSAICSISRAEKPACRSVCIGVKSAGGNEVRAQHDAIDADYFGQEPQRLARMEDAVISETPGVIGRLVNRHVTLCLSIHARMHDVEAPGEIRKGALRRLFDEAEDSSAIPKMTMPKSVPTFSVTRNLL